MLECFVFLLLIIFLVFLFLFLVYILFLFCWFLCFARRVVAAQVIPQDINWIIARAEQRRAPFPSAFMSSKPETGINHKARKKATSTDSYF